MNIETDSRGSKMIIIVNQAERIGRRYSIIVSDSIQADYELLVCDFVINQSKLIWVKRECEFVSVAGYFGVCSIYYCVETVTSKVFPTGFCVEFMVSKHR